MNRLRTFAGLDPAARGGVVYGALLIAVATIVLRVGSVARCAHLLRWLQRLSRRIHRGLAPAETARLVYASAALLRARCLPRALVLGHLLEAAGERPTVRLGVALSAATGLAAHAWVELDGAPLVDAPDLLDRFTPLPVITLDHWPRKASRVAASRP